MGMCSAPPKCCAPVSGPPQCCPPAGKKPLEQMRPAKKHNCCSADSQCDVCRQYPNKQELCSNYLRNKYIVDALSCLLRINQFQVLATLFRLACDEIKPVWHYPRDRIWSVMDNVKAPYTELQDLKIYDSLHDRCGQPIDPLDKANAPKVIRLMFMIPLLVLEQRTRLLDMLHLLNSRAVWPVILEGLLPVLEKLRLYQLVFDILQQDNRLRRFRSAREFWFLCTFNQTVADQKNGTVVRKPRRKKNAKNMAKIHINEQKRPARRPPPIFCTRRPVEAEETVEAAGRPEETNNCAVTTSRRSSINSRCSSTVKQANHHRWIPPAATGPHHLLPHSTPILGLRSLYLSW